MKGYFAYVYTFGGFEVDVKVHDRGTFYVLEFLNSYLVARRPVRTDLPLKCMWYVELADGRVFVNRNGLVSEAVLLEPSLESLFL